MVLLRVSGAWLEASGCRLQPPMVAIVRAMNPRTSLRFLSILVASGSIASACSSRTPTTIAVGTSTTRPESSTTASPGPIAAKASSGCATSATISSRPDKITITSSGESRWFLRHVPSTYVGSTPMPLVIDVHGYQEGASIHAIMSRLPEYGEAHGFITVGPNGTGTVTHWDTSLTGKDLKFIGDMLDATERDLCIDTNRVYVTGLSQGAFMTSAISCVYADRIAAAAPVAGVMSNIKNCQPARAVPLVTFHGTADGFVAFDGGLGKSALNLPSPDGKGKIGDIKGIKTQRKGLSIPEQVAGWASGAQVVKIFNCTGSNNMENPRYAEGAATMFYCGDHASAKAIAAQLAQDLGFEPVDAGPLASARLLEPLAMLWVTLAYKQGMGRDFAFRLAHR